MIRAAVAQVARILSDEVDFQELDVKMPSGSTARAICYPGMTGRASEGDRVIVNTTAVDLGLGSGGWHFVIWVEGREELAPAIAGRIMKLRYTPMQIAIDSYEEDPANQHAIAAFRGLRGMPVVVCELHSMVAPVLAGVSSTAGEARRVAYIMTDGAALPISISSSVRRLKREGFISATITAGHAFGGDYEAVNVHSALVCASEIARCDVAVVAMGPGIVGTATHYGFSGIEQGTVIDAVNRMGGVPVLAPRLSRADPRPRHRPVSHHTITVLSDICCTRATCVIASDMDPPFAALVRSALLPTITAAHHRLVEAQGREAMDLLRRKCIRVTTMGRGFDDEPDFFLTCGAAGAYAAEVAADRS